MRLTNWRIAMSRLAHSIDRTMRFEDIVTKFVVEDSLTLKKHKSAEFKQEYVHHLRALRRLYLHMANELERELGRDR